jgi:hypothetical protein
MLVIQNARYGERFSIKCAASFKKPVDHFNRIYSAITLDLNLTGACLFTSNLLQPGESLRLWLLHADAAELTSLDAQVVWTTIDDLYGDSAYWIKAGIRFVNLNEEQRSGLQRLLPSQPLTIRKRKSQKHLLAVLP